MKLNVKANEPNYLEVEFEGEDYGLPNALREILINNKDVEFAACKQDHPQVAFPTLVLRTKSKKAFDLLSDAVDELADNAKKFKAEMKAAKKPKGK